jgi:4-hydroxythreonine-4-phosphate dehydrogenase
LKLEGLEIAAAGKPVLGITMGDPAGIGPEVAVKAVVCGRVYDICRPVIFGDAGIIRKAVEIAGLDASVGCVSEVGQARFEHGTIDVVEAGNVDLERLEAGKVSAVAGEAAFEAVRKVIEAALEGAVDGTVTGPINKESINRAGFQFAGHTEIYAHFTGTSDYAMMLVEGDLRIVHVSTHVSLRQACELVKKERIVKVIELAAGACKKLGIESPRIGVAGLNPHAGDGGLFGFEEEGEIGPAVEAAGAEGINVEGPVPADTLFAKAKGRWYDVVVAMYHDQGHIPLKLAGFKWDAGRDAWESVRGVNITLGLPIVRTSVDHGTAFDIAGKGVASAESMILAIEYACKMAGAG